MDPNTYVEQISRIFREAGDPERAVGQARYMRHQFEFFGLRSPEWKSMGRKFIQTHGLPEGPQLREVIRLCFQADQRELHYFATELAQRCLPMQAADFVHQLEDMITTKSWWDTVDWLAKLAGLHFKKHPQLTRPTNDRWIRSADLWLQRSAILFQLTYKDSTDEALLFSNILKVADSKEFFLQKASGWALRQYSRVGPEKVVAFIRNHELPALTKREGLKWLINSGWISLQDPS